MNLKRTCFFVLFLAIAGCTFSESEPGRYLLEEADPAGLGVSADSLERVTQFLDAAVEKNKIPGAVAMVVKDGRIVYREAVGFGDLEAEEEMRTDHIFRIASMTKPVTSTAILMLAERGELSVDDPVSDYIPEFSDPEVLEEVSFSDTTWTSRPAKREVTIHDLLTHTSGISYGFIDSTMNAIYQKNGVPDGVGGTDGLTIAETMHSLGELPLRHDPGERRTYGLSTDVLGRVVEVASGVRFDRFLKQEIFDPLGMDDTRFVLDSEQQSRLIPLYRNPAPNELERLSPMPGDSEEMSGAEQTPGYFSGGAGLMSTASDYQRFMQTVLNGGRLGETRIFGEETARWLSENQIGEMRVGEDGFSYGFAVTLPGGNTERLRKPGRLQWGGIFQTLFWIDPARNTTVVLMSQVYPSAHRQEIYEEFETGVNQAFLD